MKLKFLQENLIDEKSIIKILKDYIDISRKPKSGSVFLTKDGTFINLGENEDDSHGDIISYLENEDIFLFDDHWQFSENFGYIRMNSGTTTDFNAYIEFLEDKPTAEQYDGIENWLYYVLNSGVKEVEINVPNSKSIRYSLVDYLPEDIIKKVKRYYSSGTLYEKWEIADMEQDDPVEADVFVSDDVRDIIREINKSSHWEQYKFILDDNKGLYIMLDPFYTIHDDAFDFVVDNYWYPELINNGNDAYGDYKSKHWNTKLIYIMVTFGVDEKGMPNDLGQDYFDYAYIYPKFNILTRTKNFVNTELYKLLGKEDRVIDVSDVELFLEDVDMSSEQDSEGNILTLEQAKYFSNSKVKDKSGRLLVCYHSTDDEFDEFDSSYSWDNFGFHFGTKKAAEDIGGQIMKSCYLNITNPLVLKEDLQYWDAFSFIRLLYENPQLQKDIKIDGWEEIKQQYKEDLEYNDFDESFYCAEYGEAVRDALYNSKYDGVIYPNWGEDAGSISYMCFYPEQIKYVDNQSPTRSKRMNEGAYDDEEEEDVSEQIINEFLDIWDEFYHCSTQDILDLLEYTPSDKIDASSPMFILPDGKIVNVADVLKQRRYKYHLVHHALPQVMAYVILKDICSSYGVQVEQFMYEEDSLLDKVTDEMLNNLTYSKDWARINCGTSYVETRFYCVLPNYMKSAQYSALEEWLLWGEQNNRHEVLVFCGNEHQSQKYKFDELFTEGIMKKIKRFYSSGVLHEDIRVQKEFEPYTAGYILENGDLVILDEYHGEDTTYNNKGLVEFSNTHNEDDTCIRVYKTPTKQQYERMEEIFQHYLDNEQYCKVEIWNSKTGYDFYEIFSLVEGACSDDSWNERVGNWSGYDLVKVVKNYYNKRKIDEILQEVFIYRGEGERNYSVGRTPMAGLFYATDYDDASNFSDNVVKYKLNQGSKIYKGQSSLNYCIENDLMNIQDKDLKNMLGVSTLIDMYEESSVPDGYFPKDEYLDDRPFFGTQLIAKKDLQKKGYDGAYWKWEDDLTPQQYQIWNMSVVEKLDQIKEDFSNIDKSEYLKFQSYVESIIDRKIKIVNRELDKFGFEVEYIDDYDFTENDEWIGVFYNEIQDAADVFPIAINIPFLYRECKKDKYLKDDLPYHIEKTIWHEAGHGIFEYLYDVFDLEDLDEEEVVEEYASYQVGDMNRSGDLLDYLYQYLEDN